MICCVFLLDGAAYQSPAALEALHEGRSRPAGILGPPVEGLGTGGGLQASPT